MSGEYSHPPPTPPTALDNLPQSGEGKDGEMQKEQDGIRIGMFKALIGTGHREFSSNRQQVT